eukprot:CAMPEP_0195521536 /NCGR_PEP_ID=MMETSP0794_2-20130614/18910_1 /TAXON_ID=515487 /ORGANISM="Stephanopyxis turris, Strain CCMP 815" /LENGTH=84 /DNA_ID=CAMNT_0040651111 /DNA_START=550 /DNA_END=804 /DNA_ORIENTATION=+
MLKSIAGYTDVDIMTAEREILLRERAEFFGKDTNTIGNEHKTRPRRLVGAERRKVMNIVADHPMERRKMMVNMKIERKDFFGRK